MEADRAPRTVAELEWELDQLSQECRRQEALQLEWTGNLGRWQWEVPTNLVTFNPWKVRALGYGQYEVPQPVGFEFFTRLLHPDDYEPVMDNMRRHLRGQSDAYEVEYRIRAKDGTWRWYFDRGVISRRGAQGQPLVVSGIVFDVTARMELLEQLRQKNEELAAAGASRDRFFSLLAHDLRGALGGLVKVLDLIHSHSFDPQGEAEALGLASESAHTTYELLDNLLLWSSVHSGQKVLAVDPVSVQAVLRTVVAQTGAQARAKGMSINVPQDDVRVLVDPMALETVLRNLVSNAIKFSRDGGRVELTVGPRESWADVTVVDHGVGIPPARLSRLFDVGGLSSTPGTLGEGGSGLGLVLCRELVEKCAGTLVVNSTEGEGTRVTVKLPLVP